MKWHGGQGQEAELTANSACGHGHVTAPQHEAGQPRDRGDEQRDGQKLEAGRRAGPWRGSWAREGPSSSPDPGDREAAEQGGLGPGAARPGEAEATRLRDSFTGGKAPPGSANGLVPRALMPPTPHRPGPFTLFWGAAFIAHGPRMRGRGAMEGGAWWPWGGAAGGASGPGGSPKVGIEGAPTPSLWSEGGDRAEGTLSAWCPLPNSKLLPRAPSRQSPESRADGAHPGPLEPPWLTENKRPRGISGRGLQNAAAL